MVSKEEDNFLRIVYLHYRVAAGALTNFFDKLHPSLSADLNKPGNKAILQDLYIPPPRKKRVLYRGQWDTLYPPPGTTTVTSADLDLTLIVCLLRNIPPLVTAPPTGFDNLPAPHDKSDGANIARLKYYNNFLVSHTKDGTIPNADFVRIWSELEQAITGLDNSPATAARLKDAKTKMLDNSILQLMQLVTKVSYFEEELKHISSHIDKDVQEKKQLKQMTETLDERLVIQRDVDGLKRKLDQSQYFTIIGSIIVNMGSSVFRNILKRRLANIENIGELFLSKKKGLEDRLNTIQKSIIFPEKGTYSGDLNDLDIETLYILLREFCDFRPHSQGWGKFPNDDDHCLSANIDRIELLRKAKMDRYVDNSIEKAEFQKTCRILVHAMAELGANVQMLLDLLYLSKSSATERRGSKPTTEFSSHKQSHIESNEWFFALSIVCDGFVVDCIIGRRLQLQYKTLQIITKKKGLEMLSGRPPGFCNQWHETDPVDIQQFWRVCKFHYDPIGRSPSVCNQLFETEQIEIQQFWRSCKLRFDPKDKMHPEICCAVQSSIEFEKLFFFNKTTHSSDSKVKSELYNSIYSNFFELCRYILVKSNTSVMLPLLGDVLDTAIKTQCTETIQVVTSRILKEFYQKHKKWLGKDTSIWLGIECACDTMKVKGYENCLCSSSKPKIIIERYQSSFKDSIVGTHFYSFSTKVIDFIEPNSTEASIVANRILETSASQLIEGNIPGKIAKQLFKEHRNLSVIYPSSMRSKGFKHPESHTIEQLNCINLVCKIKGVIPVGETHFPLKIEGVQTDVLEGSTHLLGTLRIGDNVTSTSAQGSGTLGGFVKYYGLNTFLTCAHVVFGTDNVHSISKEKIHLENCHMMTDSDIGDVTACTLIRHMFKHDNHDPSETSIDAALAMINVGDLSSFNIARDDQTRHCCSGLGLSSPYLNHNAIDPVSLRDARAFCGVSGNQKSVVTTDMKQNVLVRMPSHIQSGKITMFNQICLYGMQFQPGDSGTCVYVHTPGYFNRLTGCIGMLIAESTCGHFVLTPMKEILKIFDL